MKQYQVIFAPEARDDLFAFYDWIAAAASPDTALSYIQRIETYCLGFTHAAERGTCRDNIRPSLRVVGFERHVTITFFRRGRARHHPADFLRRAELVGDHAMIFEYARVSTDHSTDRRTLLALFASRIEQLVAVADRLEPILVGDRDHFARPLVA